MASAAIALSLGCSSLPAKEAPAGHPTHPTAEARGGAPLSVLLISDIHFEPFHDKGLAASLVKAPVTAWEAIFKAGPQKNYSDYKSDTNYSLLTSALAAMKSAAPSPAAVILSGDVIPHGFEEEFAELAPGAGPAGYDEFAGKTIQFVAMLLERTFPGAQILPAVGNNDTSCGDYMDQPHSKFLKTFGEAWQASIHDKDGRFSSDVANGGYYSVPMEAGAGRLRLIVLNGSYWSSRYSNKCGKPDETPDADELRWLDKELAAAESRRERVWLVNHISGGIDIVKTNATNPSPCEQRNFLLLYKTGNNASYFQTLARHSAAIELVVNGHTHMNEFHLFPAGGKAVIPALTVPAVSPIFSNNPGFEVLSVDPARFGVLDARVFAADLARSKAEARNGADAELRWAEEYRFVEAYHKPDLSAASLQSLVQELRTDPRVREQFKRYNNGGGATPAISIVRWDTYSCSMTEVDAESYGKCLCP